MTPKLWAERDYASPEINMAMPTVQTATYNRLVAVLASKGVTTWEQLAQWTEHDLLRAPNLGPKSIDVAKRHLRERGLSLRPSPKLAGVEVVIVSRGGHEHAVVLRQGDLVIVDGVTVKRLDASGER